MDPWRDDGCTCNGTGIFCDYCIQVGRMAQWDLLQIDLEEQHRAVEG